MYVYQNFIIIIGVCFCDFFFIVVVICGDHVHDVETIQSWPLLTAFLTYE